MRTLWFGLLVVVVGYACSDTQAMDIGNGTGGGGGTGMNGAGGNGGPSTSITVTCDKERVQITESRNSEGVLDSTFTNTTYYAVLDVPDVQDVIIQSCYAANSPANAWTQCPQGSTCTGLLTGEVCSTFQAVSHTDNTAIVTCGSRFQVEYVDPNFTDIDNETRYSRVVVYY